MLTTTGGMAPLLSVVGVSGVMAYAVMQRRREIGVRIALGASRVALETLFVRHGVTLALTGVVCGLAGAATLTRE